MTNLSQMRWSRRDFGLFTGAALLATTTGCGTEPSEPAASASTDTLTNLGLQLYTVRESFVEDALATMKVVAAAGFSEVEFGGGGYFERDPGELRGFLDEAGLAAPSIHCSTVELSEQMDRVLTVAKTLGARNVVLPWVPEELRGSVEAWQQVAAICNSASKRLAGEGITFAYHNHEFEFDAVDGETTGWDILAQEGDLDRVLFEVDFFWAVAAKQDIDALIAQHAGRISLCHIKDMKEDGSMCLPGEGVIDYAAILKQAPAAGLKHFFVEDDGLLKADPQRLAATSAHLLGMEIA